MNIDYLQRTSRKTLSIVINEKAEIIVKAPKNMPNDKILNFIDSKQKWIETKVTEIKKQNKIHNDLFQYNKILFCGKKYNVLKDKKAREVSILDSNIIIKSQITLKKEVNQLEKFLKNCCIEIVGQRLKYFSNIMQLEPKEIRLINAKHRWGTCDSEGVISFNWRLIMMPPSIIDYVIVHELAHIMELNHSNAFWTIVSTVLPNVKDTRNLLKKSNFVLQLFREIPINN